jgi:transposase InsO family protein
VKNCLLIFFLYKDMFTHFGVPRDIVTDQRAYFISKLMQSITQQYQIKHQKSSLYHPRANGQVESTKNVLEAIWNKKL